MNPKYMIYILTLLFITINARRRPWSSREGLIKFSPPGPIIFSTPVKQQLSDETTQIKNKLLSMVGQSKGAIDKKMESIETVHDLYKNNTVYKIGYVVSFINKTHDGLKEMYRYLEDNGNGWNVLKMLNSYEKVIKANEFLSDMIKILNNMVTRQSGHKPSNKMEQQKEDKNFAWSYYDDETKT